MYENGEDIRILDRLIKPESGTDRETLDRLWASLPQNPRICWYPSAGLCCRDLMVWQSPGMSEHFAEPDLFIHTDYLADYTGPRYTHFEHSDGLARTKILSTHTMPIRGPVNHHIRRSFVTLSNNAVEQPLVTIKEVMAESFQYGTTTKPVLYFHFENFSWFDQFVIRHGLRLSHFFKVREGCGFGGARYSVSNLYPKLAAAGCRTLVMDSEVHWIDWLLNQYYLGKPALPTQAFELKRIQSLRRLSGMAVHAYQLKPSQSEDWFQAAAAVIANNAVWDQPPPAEALSQCFEPPMSCRRMFDDDMMRSDRYGRRFRP